MKVGVDLDGTISKISLFNPKIKLPGWLFIVLVPIALLVRPDKEARAKLKELEGRGWEIIVISARPSWTVPLTRRWLKQHQIPFHKVFCVGFGKGTQERKLEIVSQENIGFVVDNDQELVVLLHRQDVRAARSFR